MEGELKGARGIRGDGGEEIDWSRPASWPRVADASASPEVNNGGSEYPFSLLIGFPSLLDLQDGDSAESKRSRITSVRSSPAVGSWHVRTT